MITLTDGTHLVIITPSNPVVRYRLPFYSNTRVRTDTNLDTYCRVLDVNLNQVGVFDDIVGRNFDFSFQNHFSFGEYYLDVSLYNQQAIDAQFDLFVDIAPRVEISQFIFPWRGEQPPELTQFSFPWRGVQSVQQSGFSLPWRGAMSTELNNFGFAWRGVSQAEFVFKWRGVQIVETNQFSLPWRIVDESKFTLPWVVISSTDVNNFTFPWRYSAAAEFAFAWRGVAISELHSIIPLSRAATISKFNVVMPWACETHAISQAEFVFIWRCDVPMASEIVKVWGDV